MPLWLALGLVTKGRFRFEALAKLCLLVGRLADRLSCHRAAARQLLPTTKDVRVHSFRPRFARGKLFVLALLREPCGLQSALGHSESCSLALLEG